MKKQSTIPYILGSVVGFALCGVAVVLFLSHKMMYGAASLGVGIIIVALMMTKIGRIEQERYQIAEDYDSQHDPLPIFEDIPKKPKDNGLSTASMAIIREETQAHDLRDLQAEKKSVPVSPQNKDVISDTMITSIFNEIDEIVEDPIQDPIATNSQISNDDKRRDSEQDGEEEVLVSATNSYSVASLQAQDSGVDIQSLPNPYTFSMSVDTIYSHNLEKVLKQMSDNGLLHHNDYYDCSLQELLRHDFIDVPVWETIVDPVPLLSFVKKPSSDGGIKEIQIRVGMSNEQLETIALLPPQRNQDIMAISKHIKGIQCIITYGAYRYLSSTDHSFDTRKQGYRIDITIPFE